MANRVALRFALLSLLLIAVALVLGVLHAGYTTIIVAMALAWLVVTLVEWSFSRREIVDEDPALDPAASGADGAAPEAAPPAAEEPAQAPTPEPSRRSRRRRRETAEAPAPEPVPTQHHVRVLPPVERAEGEPEPALAPEPVATAELEPEPDLEPPPEEAPVRGEPRVWNLEQLERLAAAGAGEDAARDEEWSFLFLYLREFAETDGALPLDFDGLVRESFSELVADVEGA